MPGAVPDQTAHASGSHLVSSVVLIVLQDPGRRTMGKGSEKIRTNAKKNKLREKAKRLISEGKKLTGELVRYDSRHKKTT
jgi:hypothetical protein